MYQDLKRLIKHSSIYTAGNLVYRGAAFFLIPLYVHYLKPAEYGMLEMFYVTVTLSQTLISSGIAHATLRFYFEYKDEADQKKVISTAMLTTMVIGIVGALALISLSIRFSSWLFDTTEYASYFRLAFLMLAFEITKEIDLAFIRAREYSLFFILVSFLQLFSLVGLNFYMVAVLEKGVYGILLGNLISTMLTWILLTGFTVKQCGLRFEWLKLRAIVTYGYPLMLSGFIGTVSKNADRFFLSAFTSLEVVGLYALASKLGGALQTFVVEPFTRSYGPFRFSIMRESNAQAIYARVMTYFFAGVTFVGLLMAMFSEEIIRLVSGRAYYGSAALAPWFLVDVILFGMLYNLQTGVYVTKSTKYMLYITFSSVMVNLAMNLLLVRRFGVYGAIASILTASLFSVVATWKIAQGLFPVHYEYRRLLKIFVWAAALLVVGKFIPIQNIYILISLKGILSAGYPFLVAGGNFLSFDERDKIRAIWSYFALKFESKPSTTA